jgi:hypothetical protein
MQMLVVLTLAFLSMHQQHQYQKIKWIISLFHFLITAIKVKLVLLISKS